MANRQTDPLFRLVKSLTKAEKRHFRIYATRTGGRTSIKFMQLFDLLDRQSTYNETAILRKAPDIKRSQLSNLKAHLYKQLLTALRLFHLKHDEYLQLREQIDQARILYAKGLYAQSLKLLGKTKAAADETFPGALPAEIVEFEKQIEAHYISRNLPQRTESLSREAEQLTRRNTLTASLSNLAMQTSELFIRQGHIRNQTDHRRVKAFFYDRLPPFRDEDLDFFGRMYLFQAWLWYYSIQLEFPRAYRYAAKWVDLFRRNPDTQQRYTDLYLKALHQLLSISFNLLNHQYFQKTLHELRTFGDKHRNSLSLNDRTTLQTYLITHEINAYFMTGKFSEGARAIPRLEQELEHIADRMDENRIILIHYKIACLYFGSGDNINAINYLNQIINAPRSDVRLDLHCFARILNLIAHFELGNDVLVQNQIRSVYRFLIKMDSMQAVQQEIFRFLRRLSRLRRPELRDAFIDLREKLLRLEHDPYLSRPFFYLDIISWLESKIHNRTVECIIRDKFRERSITD